MKLNYKAATKDGKIIKGIVEAKDIREAAIYLRNRGFLPIRINSRDEKGILKYFSFLNRVKSSNVVFFTRQLSSMLESGLTLMQALNILKDQMQSQIMTEIVRGVITEVEDGKSFSIAISKYPNAFSSVYISLIKAAETSGLLDKVLLRLSENLEKREKLKGTIKSALMYPIIIIMGMMGIVVLMMVFVIPQLAVLYTSLNIELPLPTKIVVGFSGFLTTFWPLVLGFTLLAAFVYRRWHEAESGQLIIDNAILKLPIFGKLISQTILTEFTRTLGLLIGAGTLVVESLKETSDIT